MKPNRICNADLGPFGASEWKLGSDCRWVFNVAEGEMKTFSVAVN